MDPPFRQWYRFTGHLFFLALFLMAALFFKERILYADSAWQVFKIINFSGFNIEAGRYGTVITQLIPLLAVRMELPLGFAILGYSLSFVLVYYGIYLLSTYVLKNGVGGLAIMLVLVVGIRHSFFHSVTETHQAMVYIILFFSWLYYPLELKNKITGRIVHLTVAVLIMVLCYFVHPVSLFPLLFIMGYRMVDRKDWRNYSLYILAIITTLIFSLKFLTTDAASYEGEIFSSFAGALDSTGDFFNLYSFRFFLKRVGAQYLFLVAMALATGIYYLYRKAWLKLAWFVFAGGGFFLITVLTYAAGDSDMAMERAFMPLGIFVILPFLNDFIKKYSRPAFPGFAFVVIALLISLGGIMKTGGIYRERQAYIDNLLEQSEQLPGNRFLLEKQDADMSRIIVPWAIAAETLLRSAMESPGASRTIFIADDLENLSYDRNDPDLFLAVSFWRDWNAQDLNLTYLKLGEGSYTRLSPE